LVGKIEVHGITLAALACNLEVHCLDITKNHPKKNEGSFESIKKLLKTIPVLISKLISMKSVVKMGQILNPLDANSRLRTFETTLGINFKTYLNKYQCFFRFLFDQSSKSQICLRWLEEIYNHSTI